MTIGQRIAQLRHERDWTQRELAALAGVTQAAIHLLETEQRQPSLRVAKQLARAFGISLTELDPELAESASDLTPPTITAVIVTAA